MMSGICMGLAFGSDVEIRYTICIFNSSKGWRVNEKARLCEFRAVGPRGGEARSRRRSRGKIAARGCEHRAVFAGHGGEGGRRDAAYRLQSVRITARPARGGVRRH